MMNSIEAMWLTPYAAQTYLSEIDQNLCDRFGEIMPVEVALVVNNLRENLVQAQSGFLTLNEALAETLDFMDELDEDDYFGSWGWRHHIMGEDS